MRFSNLFDAGAFPGMTQLNQHKLNTSHGSNMTWISMGLQRQQKGSTSTQRIYRHAHATPIDNYKIGCGSQAFAGEQGDRSQALSNHG